MAAAPALAKHFHINVVINLKRTKEEMQFAEKETERLHALIGSDRESLWAQQRLEKIHEMVLMPSAKHIKNELVEKLKDDQALEASSIEAEKDSDDD